MVALNPHAQPLLIPAIGSRRISQSSNQSRMASYANDRGYVAEFTGCGAILVRIGKQWLPANSMQELAELIG